MLPSFLQSNLAASRVPKRWKIKITQALSTTNLQSSPFAPLYTQRTAVWDLSPKLQDPLSRMLICHTLKQPSVCVLREVGRGKGTRMSEWLQAALAQTTLSRNIWKEDLVLIFNSVADFLRKIMFNSKYTRGHFSSRQVVLRSTKTLSSANN